MESKVNVESALSLLACKADGSTSLEVALLEAVRATGSGAAEILHFCAKTPRGEHLERVFNRWRSQGPDRSFSDFFRAVVRGTINPGELVIN